MITREQRERELKSKGTIDYVKRIFKNNLHNIPEKYIILIADYLDSVNMVKNDMNLDPNILAKRLPEVLTSIVDTNLGGIYGRTDNSVIQMNQNLDYESNKLYFFHELTHALQTYNINGNEQCGFYNGKNGLFLTEGATQYTAEILYHISNDTDFKYRNQINCVRGQSSHIVYSPLNEYQFNGNILTLLSMSMDLPLPQVLSLAYNSNGREALKQIYESMEGNYGKFDEFMFDLEKIYSIDKLIISGFASKLTSTNPVLITSMDGTKFYGNLQIQNELICKVERELAANFICNHDENYIVQNYNNILPYLTTPSLKQNFMNAVNELSQYQSNQL